MLIRFHNVSARRIGELQRIFDSPPEYGSQLDWTGFSVHDAATILRRFLNYLPEPVIVSRLDQDFRDVIGNITQIGYFVFICKGVE
jgi:hypothetical protein